MHDAARCAGEASRRKQADGLYSMGQSALMTTEDEARADNRTARPSQPGTRRNWGYSMHEQSVALPKRLELT